MTLQTSGPIGLDDIWEEFSSNTLYRTSGFGATLFGAKFFDWFTNFNYSSQSSHPVTMSDFYGASVRTSRINVGTRTDTTFNPDTVGYGFGTGSAQNFYTPEDGSYYDPVNYGSATRQTRIITNYKMNGLHVIEYGNFYRVTLSVSSNINANYASNAGFTTMTVKGRAGVHTSTSTASLNRVNATYFSEVQDHGGAAPSSPMQWTWDSSDKTQSGSIYEVFNLIKTARLQTSYSKMVAVKFT
jgi:hypothetical protein